LLPSTVKVTLLVLVPGRYFTLSVRLGYRIRMRLHETGNTFFPIFLIEPAHHSVEDWPCMGVSLRMSLAS
jgi:hypothetical protein